MELLDQQLAAGLRGDFEKGWEIALRLEKETPNDPRAMFNRGWYYMMRDELLKGQQLMDAGRWLRVFGNPHIGSEKPIWRGEEGTVLLNLEGGLGDQIHGFRFAFELQKRGNRVIVSCSPELASIFSKDFPIVEHAAACGAFHDYWLPSMSAVTAFNLEYKDLDDKPYIARTAEAVPNRIGVRWSGNPQFEHEQYRTFPSELLFDALEGRDCISLQRDERAEELPAWMKQADVSNWTATRKSISKCELVITSCTSIAHLAAAMGITTWIIVPILSYYLWALPGETTPWYESVRLFRQEMYKDWKIPFEKLKKSLSISLTRS